MTDDLLQSYVFDLPDGLIAQHPAQERDASRLLVLDRDGNIQDKTFKDLPGLLRPGDLLVRNDVRVIPARLRCKRSGGGAAELLLVHRDAGQPGQSWRCMARPASKFKTGREFVFGSPAGQLRAVVTGRSQDLVCVRFDADDADFMDLLTKVGEVPLPPYITRSSGGPDADDTERYQTTYAARPGAVAAPTAGLHFTPGVDAALAERGVRVAALTLNVGPGTFKPVSVPNLADHTMHAEWYDIPPQTMEAVHAAHDAGGRVIAVGTTSVRALESAALSGVLTGWTDIFIRPGFAFRCVDGLVTNFHLPGSTLIVLVSALAGRTRVLGAYAHAVEHAYRFYSYGDAMFVWRPEAAA